MWDPNVLGFFLKILIVCSHELSIIIAVEMQYLAAIRDRPSSASDFL